MIKVTKSSRGVRNLFEGVILEGVGFTPSLYKLIVCYFLMSL